MYSQLFRFADPDLGTTQVPGTGDGLTIPLIAAGTMVPGGIEPGRNFDTQPFGELILLPDGSSHATYSVEWRFRHWSGIPSKQFTSTREILSFISPDAGWSISMSRFASVVRVQTGQVTTDAGQPYVVTAQDLADPMPIELSLRIRAWLDPAETQRVEATLTAVHLHGAGVAFYQAASAPTETPPPPLPAPIIPDPKGVPTVSEMRQLFPEFGAPANFPESALQLALDRARQIHRVRKLATMYLAAHMVALAADQTGALDGGSGVVTMEKIGPRTVSYATMARSGDALKIYCETTSYGREFLVLAATSPRASVGIRVARG